MFTNIDLLYSLFDTDNEELSPEPVNTRNNIIEQIEHHPGK